MNEFIGYAMGGALKGAGRAENVWVIIFFGWFSSSPIFGVNIIFTLLRLGFELCTEMTKENIKRLW